MEPSPPSGPLPPFTSVRFQAAEKLAGVLADLEPPPLRDLDALADLAAVARDFLQRLLAAAKSHLGEAPPLPAFLLGRQQRSPLTGSHLVRFLQTHAAIPIFGSDVLVEVGVDRSLRGVDANVAEVTGVDALPSIAPPRALQAIAELCGVHTLDLVRLAHPSLCFFHDDALGGRWRLCWLFRDVPAAPADVHEGRGHHRGHGHGSSPRGRLAALDYLVDAHDGAVVFYYSKAPLSHAKGAAPAAIASRCFGVDELGVRHEVLGLRVDGAYELRDPERRLRTYDLEGADIARSTKLPTAPVRSDGADFGDAHPAAVSAHVNVGRVFDFFQGVLQRRSVDDQGMELISVVNCASSDDERPPEWANATWWEGRMWYGRQKDASGRLRGYSAYLDITAHELTHGVIEHSAEILYQGESGALNESFSDIFGVAIANWFTVGPDSDAASWSWEFGAGLGDGGGVLRDLRDPTRTGDPDHMSKYLRTRSDSGGVHTNSNIHNKAAYLVFTATDAGGRVFTAREVVRLYYLCLVRLPQRPTFERTLRGLLDVASAVYAGDSADCERRKKALEDAYAAVGITLAARG